MLDVPKAIRYVTTKDGSPALHSKPLWLLEHLSSFFYLCYQRLYVRQKMWISGLPEGAAEGQLR